MQCQRYTRQKQEDSRMQQQLLREFFYYDFRGLPRVRARSKEIFQVQAEKSTTVGIVVGVSIELLRTSFEICSKLVD